MTNQIKEYKEYWLVSMKNGATFECDEHLAMTINKFLSSDKAIPSHIFISELGSFTRFDFLNVTKQKVASGIEEYLMQLTRPIREKLRSIQQSRGITRNSIEHVGNYVSAIQNGEI